MILFTLIGVLGLLGLVGAVVFALRERRQVPISKAFEVARDSEQDAVARFLITAARPLGRLAVVNDRDSSLALAVEKKLFAAGGAFGGQTEVFLAVQGFTLLVGFASLLLIFTGTWETLLGMHGLLGTAVPLCISATIAGLPWMLVDRRAARRLETINRELPEFAELMQMPLSAGLSVLAAMEFTARNTNGLVSEEASNVLLLTRTRALTDAEAFDLAGKRLGTPGAFAFFGALRQAHVEGARVLEVLGRQARALRAAQYQRQREKLKKLPVKLIVIFGIHLLPAVLIVIGFSFLSSMSSL